MLSGCNSAPLEQIPLAPLDWITELGGVVTMQAPIHTRDTQYHYISYDAHGERTSKYVDEVLFPTDVIVVYKPEMSSPRVFLAISPHGGCLLSWNDGSRQFEDPCYGSRFDIYGKYTFGPSPRDMDEIPSEIRGNMLWVTGKISYGEER